MPNNSYSKMRSSIKIFNFPETKTTLAKKASLPIALDHSALDYHQVTFNKGPNQSGSDSAQLIKHPSKEVEQSLEAQDDTFSNISSSPHHKKKFQINLGGTKPIVTEEVEL